MITVLFKRGVLMYTRRQIEIMKALLLNWGNDETISALSLEAEKLTTLSNCLNYLLISNNLLSSDECFNRITLAQTVMEACPDIFAHYSPNERSLSLNFNDDEKLSLLRHVQKDISNNNIDIINEIGKTLVMQNSDCFSCNVTVKKYKI